MVRNKDKNKHGWSTTAGAVARVCKQVCIEDANVWSCKQNCELFGKLHRNTLYWPLNQVLSWFQLGPSTDTCFELLKIAMFITFHHLLFQENLKGTL